MALTHTFSCTVADGTNTAINLPSHWNAAHVIAAGTDLYGLVPIGGVVSWGGTVATVPSGYLVCDGSSLLRAGSYAALYAAIGVAFGPGADAPNTFALPDLRDKFVVGGKQDDSSVVKSNIRGSLEQSITVTGATLTHSITIANHTGLSHAGVAVTAHPDLSHVAIAIADHASTQFTGTVSAHGTLATGSSGAGSNVVTVGTHAVTWPSIPAVTHDVSVNLGTHTSTALTHAITQPDAHGAAGTLVHSFTPPANHVQSIVPAFLAMPFVIRYA